MSEPIGEARVIVRPITSGFAAEAAAGLKQPLLSLGKVITGALAIKGGFDLGKQIVGDAARVQKSSETIRAEFGKAGQSIIEFADTAGLKLGIASHESEDTAARFGILFKNIGVGKAQAAEMTVNLEKLAGSIAAIRGKDPGEILGTLPLALSGSLRGLRQLGFAFSQQQLKDEALRLGLITTTKQALDPGARALAIYALATQHLGDYQQQASQHANDAYNIQKRLSAEWDHAKETLGTSLLPQISKYGVELSDFIAKGTKSGKIQHDINRVAADGKQVIEDVAGAVKDAKDAYGLFATLVGGDHNAVKILADAFFLLYARSKLIKWGIIAGGEKAIGGAAATSAGEVDVLSGSLGRLKKLGPIGVAILLDFIPRAKKSTDPHATSNSPVAKFFAGLPLAGPLFSQANKLGDEINKQLDKIDGQGADKARKKLKSVFQSPFLTETFDQAKLLNPKLTRQQFDLAQQIAANIRFGAKDPKVADAAKHAGQHVTDVIGDGVKQGSPHLSKAVTDALQQPVDAAREVLSQAKQQLATDIAAMPQAITDAVNQAKQNLNSIGSSLANDIGGFLDKRGLTSGSGALGKQFQKLRDEIIRGKGGPDTARAAQEVAAQLQARSNVVDTTSLKDRVTRRIADLSDLFNKGAIGVGKFDTRIDQVLKSAGVKAGVIQRTQGVAAADQFRADLAALKEQALALSQGPRRPGTGLAATIVRPLETLRAQEEKLGADRKAEAKAEQDLQRQQLAQARKTTAAIDKLAAKMPSKHDTAALDAFLRGQRDKPNGTAGKQANKTTTSGANAP